MEFTLFLYAKKENKIKPKVSIPKVSVDLKNYQYTLPDYLINDDEEKYVQEKKILLERYRQAYQFCGVY